MQGCDCVRLTRFHLTEEQSLTRQCFGNRLHCIKSIPNGAITTQRYCRQRRSYYRQRLERANRIRPPPRSESSCAPRRLQDRGRGPRNRTTVIINNELLENDEEAYDRLHGVYGIARCVTCSSDVMLLQNNSLGSLSTIKRSRFLVL